MALGWNRRCFKNMENREFQTYLSGSAESSDEGFMVGTVHGFTPEASTPPGAMAKHRALWSIPWHSGVGRGEQAQLVFFIFTEQVLPVGHLFWKRFNLALLYLNSLPPSQVPPLSQEHLLMGKGLANLSASLCSVSSGIFSGLMNSQQRPCVADTVQMNVLFWKNWRPCPSRMCFSWWGSFWDFPVGSKQS